jgi:3,4-dihydroxy 2-butanone 4-phosphate synthase/GTP cyclohydrolase II
VKVGSDDPGGTGGTGGTADPAGTGAAVAIPVTLVGRVVRGDQRGRELGFPTANIDLEAGSTLPPDGVYAGRVRVLPGGADHLAAISIGSRPTFYGDGGVVLLEAYLLDFAGDLYGANVRVGVDALVRGQVRFASEDELIETMRRDVEQVRALAGRSVQD